MEIIAKKFNELELEELYEILKLRSEVFVVEQNCVYQDVDDKDQQSIHLMIKEDREVIGYLRLILYEDRAMMGRVVVSPRKRKLKLGYKLVDYGLDYLFDNYHYDGLTIEGQVRLEKFYNSLGFKRISKDFILDNLLHCDMEVTREDRDRLKNNKI